MRRTILTTAIVALLVGGGSATAAHLITSGQIANGTIRNVDVHKNAISLNRLSPGVQRLLRSIASTNRTSASSQSAPTGAQGPQGASGPQGTAGPKGDAGQRGSNGLDSDQPRTVTASDLNGFTPAPKGDNGDTADNGTIGFTAPPVAPSLGSRSLEMTTANGKPVVMYAPLPSGSQRPLIGELTKASYGSLVKSEPQSAEDVSLQIEVTGSSATHFASGYTTVVYEPYLNSSPDKPGEWHRHSVDTGRVWSSQPLPGGNCTQASPCPFSTFVAENPNAVVQTVKLRVGQNSGQGWAGFDAFVDDVSLGFGPVVRYDLGG